MVAPALVLVTEKSDQGKSDACFRQLWERMVQVRPQLNTHLAFADQPTAIIESLQASQQRVHTAHLEDDDTRDDLPEQLAPAEIVLVPLDVASVHEVHEPVTQLADALRAAFPDSQIEVSRPLGPSSDLLTVVDLRLRSTLSSLRVTELDGLVLLAPSGSDARGTALLSRRARQWSGHHKLPVALAIADESGAALASAIGSLFEQGRRRIAVGSLFISSDDEFAIQLEAAKAYGALTVGAPLGADDRVLELVMGRYAYTAMAMLNTAESADSETQGDSASI